jgi:hypothetical protein
MAIQNTSKRWIGRGLAAVALALAGCRAFVADVPTIAPLPTFTPSPTVTETSTASPTSNVTPTAPLTVTPAVTNTPPLGPSVTPEPFATPGGAAPAASGPPTINYFVATPEEPAPGESLLLFWSSEGATDAFIYRVEEDGGPGRTWTVDPAGSLSLESVAPDEDGTATYVLAVTNTAATVEQELVVALGLACGETWFYADETDEAEEETDACPDGPESTSQAVYQPFENGRMFWIGETGEIIILFNDGDEPAWLAVTDTGPEPDPDDQVDEPPQGLIRPLRGFGAVWTNNADVQARLGWATAPESPFDTTIQRGEGQIALTSPAGEAIVLLPDGEAWEMR